MTKAGKTVFRHLVDRKLCKKCGICTHFCPPKVLEPDEHGYPAVNSPDKCTGCMMCFLRCPDFALEVISGEKKP